MFQTTVKQLILDLSDMNPELPIRIKDTSHFDIADMMAYLATKKQVFIPTTSDELKDDENFLSNFVLETDEDAIFLD